MSTRDTDGEAIAAPGIELSTGTRMPLLGLGVFQASPEETARAVDTALRCGYRLIDTAAAYGNEGKVGEGIRRSGVDRSEIFVTTKLWLSDYGFDSTFIAFEASLRRLGLDYIDLYLIHHPVPSGFDETIASYRAAEQLLADGRTRAIGVSNQRPEHLRILMEQTDVPPAVNQVELHPYFTQPDLRALHARQGIVTQAWSPLGAVRIYNSEHPDEATSPLADPTIAELARNYGKSPAQIIIRWHLEHGISPIPKSVSPQRIVENFEVFDFTLAADDVAAIDRLDTGVRGGPDPDTIDRALYPFVMDNEA